MCGILGVWSKNNALDYKGKIISTLAIMQKRGPDSNGTYFSDNVALGHVRLSIIDVSNAASQPFTDNTGRYSIVFNGEIYNFLSLKKDLLSKGYKFRSSSDTEVLLNLYIEYGTTFLNRLNGFFAFAIFDKQEKKLFIARDRMGIKPLLIYRNDSEIIFASEMKAIIAMGAKAEMDNTSISQYFQLNYCPPPNTAIKNVTKLEPGSFLIIDKQGERQEYYYDFPDYNKSNYTNISYQDACKKLDQLLDESVSKRMISDVPLGFFLSGGIDSSVITTLAARHHNNIKTFSIGYADEPMFDETLYAELVAKKIKSDHTSFKLTNDDLFNDLNSVLDYLDEPFADSSSLAVNILCKHTKQHVTVALSGDGADEMFSGYNKHEAEFRIRNGGLKNSLVTSMSPLWKALPKSRNSKITNLNRQLDRFASSAKLSNKERYWRLCSISSQNEVDKLLKNKYDKGEFLDRKNEILKYITDDGDISQVLKTDMHLVLRGDMLRKVDLMSMANSLEVRVPFLDHNVVDFAFSLPVEYKIDSKLRKKILQDTYRNILPKELYNRPKHGFEVPLLKWFRGDLWKLINEDLLSKDFIIEQNMFDVNQIELLKKKLTSRNIEDSVAKIWALLVFQNWYKKYIKL